MRLKVIITAVMIFLLAAFAIKKIHTHEVVANATDTTYNSFPSSSFLPKLNLSMLK